MPRIDFYILPSRSTDGRPLLACRLAEKAYRLGHQVYIHTETLDQARQLDDLLWTFRAGSFVPHGLHGRGGDEAPPVVIGWGEAAVSAELLINLTHKVPDSLDRLKRLAELVDQDEQVLSASRQRFQFYRQQGYSPQIHRL